VNKLFWKIIVPLLGGIGATICAISVFRFSGIKNVAALIVLATVAGGVGNQLFIWLGNELMHLNMWLVRPKEGETVLAFNRLPVDEPLSLQAGGKGKALSMLKQNGYPVPDGCVLLPESFTQGDITPAAWEQVQKELSRLRAGKPAAFAVRSSALQEDSAQASFAGEFESVLDVKTDEEIRKAIQTVVHSGTSARVESYTRHHGLEGGEHPVAVVIQRMVQPEYAGVLFTVDPLTGNYGQMSGNFVAGIGEKLVSGQVSAQTFTFERPSGKYNGPSELNATAKNLHRLANMIENDLGCPQDIEWAVTGGKVCILQARPITTLNNFNPVTAVWNDTLKGNFLWSATNLMEASPEVLTPFTTSLRYYLDKRNGPNLFVRNHSLNGIICGRFYSNITVQVSAFARFFKGDARRAYQEIAGWWGGLPEGMQIPLLPLTGEEWSKNVLPGLIRSTLQFGEYRKKAPRFLAENRQKCAELRGKNQQTSTGMELVDLWKNEIFPRYCDSLIHIIAASSDIQVRVDRELHGLVGDDDANALLSNLSGKSSQLESLGPMAGLDLVKKGRLSREEYLDRYGHRGVNEAECAWPRPNEDPAWLDRQLKEWEKTPVDVDELIHRQREAYDAAWARFCEKVPGKAKYMKKRLDQVSAAARNREAVRSEATRGMAVLRAFALRAGEFLDIGDDIFFLTINEVLEGLTTGTKAIEYIPLRRETFEKYRALPPYPAVICGRFDPFTWAADPNRRSDVYDANAIVQTKSPTVKDDGRSIHGFAGALGVVEGTVRRLESLEESSSFEVGEVLVTTMTNIGWTPLFPRAAAIVTDLGAPLSHAAIVAREIGIPAVVGCGNATMRLKTGDRVRVDGGKGLVEIL